MQRIAVTVWTNGKNTFHIRVRTRDRDDHLKHLRTSDAIEVEIDGRPHRFPLPGSFWRTCNHFGGTAIRNWLKRQKLIPRDKADPRTILLTLHNATFKLSTQ